VSGSKGFVRNLEGERSYRSKALKFDDPRQDL
jgi:hypothetical protein